MEIPGIITLFPAIERLRADAKVAAGQPSISPVRVVIIKPFDSRLGFLGYLQPYSGKLSVSRKYRADYFHDIIIVSLILLNELTFVK
jgi:hypothetical protein